MPVDTQVVQYVLVFAARWLPRAKRLGGDASLPPVFVNPPVLHQMTEPVTQQAQ